MNITNISIDVLSKITSLEQPLVSFYQNIWFHFFDWVFVIIAGIVGAYVAIKIDREFKNKKRIFNRTLIKKSVSYVSDIVFTIFFNVLLIGIGLFVFFKLIKVGMAYSPSITLFIIVIAGILWLYNDKRKKEKLIRRLKIKSQKNIKIT